jgi:hypothetical protein
MHHFICPPADDFAVYCIDGDCQVLIITSSLDVANRLEEQLMTDEWHGVIELPISQFDYIRARRQGRAAIKTCIQKCYVGPAVIKSNSISSIKAFMSNKRDEMNKTKRYEFIEKYLPKNSNTQNSVACFSNFFKKYLLRIKDVNTQSYTYLLSMSRLHFFRHIYKPNMKALSLQTTIKNNNNNIPSSSSCLFSFTVQEIMSQNSLPRIILRKPIQHNAFYKIIESFRDQENRFRKFCPASAFIQVPCGEGKTLLSQKISELLIDLGIIEWVLIYVHLDNLKKQWNDEIKKIIPLKHQHRYMVRTIQTKSTLHREPGIRLTIMDEVHHWSANTFRELVEQNVDMRFDKYWLGMSAESERKDGRMGIVHQTFGDPVFTATMLDRKLTLDTFVQVDARFSTDMDRINEFLINLKNKKKCKRKRQQEEEDEECEEEESEMRINLSDFIEQKTSSSLPYSSGFLMSSSDQTVSENHHYSSGHNSNHRRLMSNASSVPMTEWVCKHLIHDLCFIQHSKKQCLVFTASVFYLETLINFGLPILFALIPNLHISIRTANSKKYETEIKSKYNVYTGNYPSFKLIFSTYHSSGEGVNIPGVDAMIMLDDPINLIQNVNRIRNFVNAMLIYVNNNQSQKFRPNVNKIETEMFISIRHKKIIHKDLFTEIE